MKVFALLVLVGCAVAEPGLLPYGILAPRALTSYPGSTAPLGHAVVAAPAITAHAAIAHAPIAYAAAPTVAVASPVIKTWAAEPLVLNGATGKPLDTASVTLAKIQHANAKAEELSHGYWAPHLLHKRSAVWPVAHAWAAEPLVLNGATGKPLDTASVTAAKIQHANARAEEIAKGHWAAPAIISAAPAVVTAHSAPIVTAHAAAPWAGANWAAPWTGAHWAGAHILKKRSVAAWPVAHGWWNHDALVLNGATGKPLDTASVTAAKIQHANARAEDITRNWHAPIIAGHPAVVAAAPTVVTAHSAPVITAHSGLWGHSGLWSGAHLLKKRSIWAASPYAGLWNHDALVLNGATGKPLDTASVTAAKIQHANARAEDIARGHWGAPLAVPHAYSALTLGHPGLVHLG